MIYTCYLRNKSQSKQIWWHIKPERQIFHDKSDRPNFDQISDGVDWMKNNVKNRNKFIWEKGKEQMKEAAKQKWLQKQKGLEKILSEIKVKAKKPRKPKGVKQRMKLNADQIKRKATNMTFNLIRELVIVLHAFEIKINTLMLTHCSFLILWI